MSLTSYNKINPSDKGALARLVAEVNKVMGFSKGSDKSGCVAARGWVQSQIRTARQDLESVIEKQQAQIDELQKAVEQLNSE